MIVFGRSTGPDSALDVNSRRVLGPCCYGDSGPWTPADITTALWLDAADADTIDETGGLVSKWDDKSGNLYAYEQGTGSDQPIIANSTLSFDGTDTLEEGVTSLGKGVDSLMVFSVFKPTDTGGPYSHFSFNTPNVVVTRIRINTSGGVYNIGGRRLDSDSFVNIASSTPATASTVIHGAIIDAENAQIAHAVNGTLESFQSWQTAGSFSDTDSQESIVGASSNGATKFNGDLNEIIVVHSDITTATRQLIEGYLAWKWALVSKLPNSHPYKYDGSVFGYEPITSDESYEIHSVARAVGDYSGNLIKVRRASDDTTQDIGVDGNGDLDTASLATFCSGTDGFLERIYGQKSIADLIQTTKANQPKIYDSVGGVNLINGKPAADTGINTDQLYMDAALTVAQPVCAFVTAKMDASAGGTPTVIISGDASASSQIFEQSGFFRAFAGSTTSFATSDTDQHILIMQSDGTSPFAQMDDNALNTTATGASGRDGLRIGANWNLGASTNFNGHIQEIIHVAKDASTIRDRIKDEINVYYEAY